MADDGICPAPRPPLDAAFVTWDKGKPFHRIHPGEYGATLFNPSARGNARFSPVKDASGAVIATIYGGTTFECAAMETVFRDVPFAAGPKIVWKARLHDLAHSIIVPTTDLKLVDFSTVGLRRLGVRRNQLIDTEATQYTATRRWAEMLYAQYPDIQGLQWVSRQDDRAMAIVLFESRIGAGTLQQQGTSLSLHGDRPTYAALLELARAMNVDVI